MIIKKYSQACENKELTENLLPESLVCSFRWVKFEEDVEDGSNRWSKPHVATLSLHSLFELRNLLTKGTILLDMEASKYEIKLYPFIRFISESTNYLFLNWLVFFHVIHYNVSLVWMILPIFFWINASITTFYQMIWGYLSKML